MSVDLPVSAIIACICPTDENDVRVKRIRHGSHSNRGSAQLSTGVFTLVFTWPPTCRSETSLLFAVRVVVHISAVLRPGHEKVTCLEACRGPQECSKRDEVDFPSLHACACLEHFSIAVPPSSSGKDDKGSQCRGDCAILAAYRGNVVV